jgi:DNA-binding transcriptional LysR family regulator
MEMSDQPLSLTGLDLVSLRLLVAAVEEGNLARAAAREHIAISAVSRRIADLELRLGVKLLHRHDRGVRPTAAAQSMLGRIRGIFALLEQIVGDVSDIRSGAKGFVRMQAHMTAVAGSLHVRIARFLEGHPGIDVELDEATSAEILHAVRVGSCDLGLVSGTVEGGELCLIPWATDELVVVVPAGSPLLQFQRLHFLDLIDYPFIAMQRDSALLPLCRHHAAAVGKSLRERAHVTSFENARKMVQAGLGVSIIPAEAAYPFIGEGGIAVRPLAEAWALRTLMLCVRSLTQLTGATRLLMEHLARDNPQSKPETS